MSKTKYWSNCKYCTREIVWFNVKGNWIAVDRESIPIEERRSLMMGIPKECIRYSALDMRKHSCPGAPKKKVDKNPYLFVRY